MKTSIKKLLSSVQFNAVLLMLMTVVTGLLLASSVATFERIDNAAQQEAMVREIAMKDRKDPELDRIQVNGLLGRLPISIDQFAGEQPYELVNSLFIGEAPARGRAADVLRERYSRLSQTATAYFNADPEPKTRKEAAELDTMHHDMLVAVDAYLYALYPVAKLQSGVLRQYITLTGYALGAILLVTFILIIASGRASRYILSDIHTLLQQEGPKSASEKLYTSEINSVALKLRQESGESALTPSKKDEVTQLPNYDGIKASFDQRPTPPKNLNTFVCVFEIDNYSKLINHFPQSVIDPVMIKIASIMKLHKMQNDLIGRIDGSHFLAVFTRPEKQKAFGDVDHIRQMIEENRFKLPHTNYHVTVSGGFTTKMSSQTIDDAVKNAREYLKQANEQGGNMIVEGKNNPKIL